MVEKFLICGPVMEMAARQLLADHSLDPSDIDHFIPHQANVRIVESLANRLEVPIEKFFAIWISMATLQRLPSLWHRRAFRAGIFKPTIGLNGCFWCRLDLVQPLFVSKVNDMKINSLFILILLSFGFSFLAEAVTPNRRALEPERNTFSRNRFFTFLKNSLMRIKMLNAGFWRRIN